MLDFCKTIHAAITRCKAAIRKRRCTHPNIEETLDIPLGLEPDIWHTITRTVTCPDCGKTYTLSASVRRHAMGDGDVAEDEL